MRHITYADKSLLVGDEAAAVLMEFAARLGDEGHASVVELNAIDGDGNDVKSSFLINSGSELMSETATTKVKEPDNSAAVAYMRSVLHAMDAPVTAHPFDEGKMTDSDRSMFEDGTT